MHRLSFENQMGINKFEWVLTAIEGMIKRAHIKADNFPRITVVRNCCENQRCVLNLQNS
jgi:hypothetical protein